MLGLLIALAAVVLAANPPGPGGTLRPAVAADGLDAANCASFRGQTRLPADTDAVAAVLGVSARGKHQWAAPPHKEGEPAAAVRFLVTFRDEKPVGSVFVPGGFALHVLKPGTAGAPPPLPSAPSGR